MNDRLHLATAARALAQGGIVAYPTEAVWGLGCEPLNRHACERLLALKRRSWRKGVILIAARYAELEPYAAPVPAKALNKALATWPGPATWLFPAAHWVPWWLTGGRDTIALRVTAHPVASALCARYGGALVSTSANISRRPPARTALQVRRIFGRTVDAVAPGALGGRAAPTPIRDLSTDAVFRP